MRRDSLTLADVDGASAGPTFVGKPIEPAAGTFDARVASLGEPSLPSSFVWQESILEVARVRKTWRSHKVDRGDMYLKRHWFEFEATDGRVAVVYFDRGARRGAARWWLYTLAERA
jgi:hypothetical protein